MIAAAQSGGLGKIGFVNDPQATQVYDRRLPNAPAFGTRAAAMQTMNVSALDGLSLWHPQAVVYYLRIVAGC